MAHPEASRGSIYGYMDMDMYIYIYIYMEIYVFAKDIFSVCLEKMETRIITITIIQHYCGYFLSSGPGMFVKEYLSLRLVLGSSCGGKEVARPELGETAVRLLESNLGVENQDQDHDHNHKINH